MPYKKIKDRANELKKYKQNTVLGSGDQCET